FGRRKDEAEFALRAPKFPFAEGLHYQGRQRDGAVAGTGFRSPQHVVFVGALAAMQFALGKVNVSPPQASEFGSAQAAKDGRERERAATAVQGANDGSDFFGCRNVDADPQLPFGAPLSLTLLASSSARTNLAYDIAGNQPFLLGIRQQGAEVIANALDHGV